MTIMQREWIRTNARPQPFQNNLLREFPHLLTGRKNLLEQYRAMRFTEPKNRDKE